MPGNESPARAARGLMNEPSVRPVVGARLPAKGQYTRRVFIVWTIFRGQARSYNDLHSTDGLRHPTDAVAATRIRRLRRMSGMSSPQNQSPVRSARGLMNEPAVRAFVGARLPAKEQYIRRVFIVWTIFRGQARSYRDLVSAVVLQHPLTLGRITMPSEWAAECPGMNCRQGRRGLDE